MLILLGATLVLSHEPSRSFLENAITELAPIAAEHLWLLISATVAMAIVSLLWTRRKNKNASETKQGAYGAVKMHGHSIWEQLSHGSEVVAALRLLYEKKFSKGRSQPTKLNSALWDHLNKTSRSFAAVIRVLPAPDVSDAVCLFYLLLRALDTIEDEMDLTKFEEFRRGDETSLDAKVRLLCDFHTLLEPVQNADFPLDQILKSNIGAAAEKALLNAVPDLIAGFRQIKQGEVVKSIVLEMGKGMAEYVVRDMRCGTTDMKDYDHYCHIVAGLVGKGLTELFANMGYEDISLIDDFAAWNSMGLLLQRTNITRDVCEDAAEGRSWWPQTIWQSGEVVPADLGKLNDLAILNKMVCNALQLIPEATRYLDRLTDPAVFGFCALPQIMAVATLAVCYNNPNVFTGVVKIRAGQAARLVLSLRARTTTGMRRKYKKEAAEMIDNIRARAMEVGDADTAACCERALESLGQDRKSRRKLITTSNAKIAMSYFTFFLIAWSARNATGLGSSAIQRVKGLDEGDVGVALAMSIAAASGLGLTVGGVIGRYLNKSASN